MNKMTLQEAILDALVDDAESIVQISEYLKFLNLESAEAEIIEELSSMLAEKKINVAYPNDFEEKSLKDYNGSVTELWFELTEKGKAEWNDI